MTHQLRSRDIIALGFMTFALFVGAGNIIFPPMVGLQAGEHVWTAAFGFLITAVGLPVLTVVALAKVGGGVDSLSTPIGKVAGVLLATVCYLAVGPLFATPRTATVSFEVGIAPLTGDSALPLFIYSLVYFAIVILVSLYPGKLLDTVGKTAPKAVEDLVPGTLPLGTVQKVLQTLVRENVSIRDMLTIVETLGDYGGGVKNPDVLAEYVRERLSRSIVRSYLDSQGTLPVLTLTGQTERMLQEAIRQADNGTTFLALNPATAQRLIQHINAAVENAVNTDGQPVVLTSPPVRPHLAQLVTRFLPAVPVISQAEIPPDIRLQSVGTVGAE